MNMPGLALDAASLAAFAVVATVVLGYFAPTLGLVDHPGGRKDHAAPVPVVGGIALVLTLLYAVFVFIRAIVPPAFLAAAAIVVVVSAWDDWKELHHVPRFVAQVIAVLVMVYGAGVELRSVGDLLAGAPSGCRSLRCR